MPRFNQSMLQSKISVAAKAAKFPWELATAAKTDVSIRPLMANVQGLLSLLKAGKVTVLSSLLKVKSTGYWYMEGLSFQAYSLNL